ncbi:hypothetical protein, partial [Robiginitalea biformata]|uniref:hypothetical protein n=1 Tax=Robiginitalea biformata TaxID=252307 RepID=UPI003D660F8E
KLPCSLHQHILNKEQVKTSRWDCLPGGKLPCSLHQHILNKEQVKTSRWDCLPDGKLPYSLVLKTKKRNASLTSKKEASFLFGSPLAFHSFFGLFVPRVGFMNSFFLTQNASIYLFIRFLNC